MSSTNVVIAADAAAPPSQAAKVVVYVYAAIVVAVLGHFLLGLPIQLTDCYGNMVELGVSWRQLMISEFTQRAYLRPLLWAQLKLVYDLSRGDYFWWFRGVHVAQVAALVALYLHLVRPRGWVDAAAAPVGLAVLISIHTFYGTVREAFPINTFLTILLCCFGAAALSLARYRWWNDVLAVLLFALAALTVESGLLVWVIFVGAALVGARGVSRAGLAVLGLALAGYFVLRFGVLHVGSPDLVERSSGYGFGVLDPPGLVARFGSNPFWFYVYNVVTSFASVLFSEPRAGIFRLAHSFALGDPDPALIVHTIASTLATAVIALYAWRRRADWRAWRFTNDDRLVLLFIVVLSANAVISYPYTKDVIMSPGGAFFALAVYVGVRDMLTRLPARGPALRMLAPAACALVLGLTWSVRVVATHVALRTAAFAERNDWAYADAWLAEHHTDISSPRALALKNRLQTNAVLQRPEPLYLSLMDARLLHLN